MASEKKRRKVGDECRTFNDKWTLDYFFASVKGAAVCLICNESVAVLKEYNIKRHYETKHSSKYGTLQGQMRKDKVHEFEKRLAGQQKLFRKATTEADISVHVSYLVSKILAKRMKAFSDGEVVKECLQAVAGVAFPEKKEIISKISLSRFTVGRRVDDMSKNIEDTLKCRAACFKWFSVALDESTDVSDTAQLVVFIRGIDAEFNITEELASMVAMMGTTRSADLYEELKKVLERLGLSMERLSGIITDGAPSMVGKNSGLTTLISQEAKALTSHDLIACHCLLHQEHLCAKSLRMTNVVAIIVKLVNFIRSKGLNHRQFRELLSDMESDYGDVLYHSEVRWLSRGQMLKRVYDLKEEIELFLDMKGKPVKEFGDHDWMCDFAFLIDITQHLNELNLRLQGKDQLIHAMFDQIKAFESKLSLWESQLLSNNLVHFETLRKENPDASVKYAEEVKQLKDEFHSRFQDFRRCEESFSIFSFPFGVSADTAPPELQMELIDLQCSAELKAKFRDVPLLDFYKFYLPAKSFPGLSCHALKMASLFGSTYICEQFFSKVKVLKSKHRNRLGDERLESSLRIATSQIEPDIEKLVKEKECQVSH